MKSGIKFLVVGGTATFTDFLVYMIISTKISVSVSKAISMCISCLISFFLNRKWTFEVREEYSFQETIKYVLAQMINIGVNVFSNNLIYGLTKQKVVAFILATVIAMCVNYCLQKFVVFKKY